MRKLVSISLAAAALAATSLSMQAAPVGDPNGGSIVVARRGADDPVTDQRRGRGTDDNRTGTLPDDRRGRGEGEIRSINRDDPAGRQRGDDRTRRA